MVTGFDGSASAEGISAKVDIVTVNWNSGVQLAECVNSVRAFDADIVAQFIVVDNGSVDGSADFEGDWEVLKIDRAGTNLGFGRACNRGAAQGTASYILLLNPDTRMTEPAISRAVAFLDSAEGSEFGICGVRQLDDDGHVCRNSARFPTLGTFASMITGWDKLLPRAASSLLMTDFDHQSNRRVDHVQGSFYLIRRTVFESLGGFDDDYFVYFEDLDLSRRASLADWPAFYLADATIFHRGGGTSGQIKGRARFYAIEARLTYGRKHLGAIGSAVHTTMTYMIEPFTTLVWQIIRYRGRNIGSVFQTVGLLARHAPRMIFGRRRGR